MKKRIVSFALMAMSLVAFTGMAQTPATGNQTQTETVKGKKSEKKGQRPEKNPYEGLNLTDAQKTKLQQLDEKRKAERQQQMEARKAEKQQNKADKQSKDALSQEARQAERQQKMEARKAAKKEYLEEVKAIIGPDQYVVFLENFYVNAGGQQGGKAMKQGQKGGKQGMAHNKSGKGNKSGKSGKKGQGQKSGRAQGAQTTATQS